MFRSGCFRSDFYDTDHEQIGTLEILFVINICIASKFMLQYTVVYHTDVTISDSTRYRPVVSTIN